MGISERNIFISVEFCICENSVEQDLKDSRVCFYCEKQKSFANNWHFKVIEIKDVFLGVEGTAKNSLLRGLGCGCLAAQLIYGGVLNSVIKFKLKTSQKLKVFIFIFTKQAIETHGTKISGKIIVK